jgi:protoporphyrinogen oxidase
MNTRREVLRSCVATNVVLALSRIADSDEVDCEYDCIIVGAGAAGLSTAYGLSCMGAKNQNISIVEMQPNAGGICWAKDEHGYRFSMGTTYLGKAWRGSAAKKIYRSLPKKWWIKIPEPFDSFSYKIV